MNTFTPNETTLIKALKISVRNTLEDAMPHLSDMWHKDSKRDHIVFAGGMFASLLDATTPNDIDLFILHGHEIIYTNVLRIWSKDTDDVKETTDYTSRLNPHVIKSCKIKSNKVNLILTNHKSRKDLIDDFDYKHCCISYGFDDIKSEEPSLFLSKAAFRAAREKILIPNKADEPQEWRTTKFLDRGFVKEPEQVKMGNTLFGMPAGASPVFGSPGGGFYIDITSEDWLG